MQYGIFSYQNETPRVGIRHGNRVVDLSVLAELGVFDFDSSVFYELFLNEFIALGKEVHQRARTQVQTWLTNNEIHPEAYLSVDEVTMHLPVRIGDYTDFYSSIEHATNVGKMFRDPENALLPNWKHLPVGYHGRASSIVVSGTDIRRPSGQVKTNAMDTPEFRPSERLDFELEMAFIVGKDSTFGEPVNIADAEDYIFGIALFNDWSARDIQKWEYVPLGPFLGKSFASSLSPWITELADLEPFRTAGPVQDPAPLPYLASGVSAPNFDIELEVTLTPKDGTPTVISRSNTKYLYWSMAQQLTHHTSNGCNVRVGDLMASGTISGKDASSYGSLLEISEGGRKPFPLEDGSQRAFLADGDTITLRAHAERDGTRLELGEVTGRII
ncbi:fumarylacetoacetase [Neolewinella aurantiaca]|uniref:fumarylacetoacetase n=1 Tax=Neolewinella aurantiaca TaxID=2602767 RepID=A0A5C7FXQ8_9BACT|nr:fumarylacetoacetase [Neolewinella aurantiaca]TXF90309.1 fumarylacetoacetase [Neolewinella aurantiaca]